MHIIGDLVQSVGVLIAGLIIKFVETDSAALADPICTLIFLVIIMFTTIRVMNDIVKILMCHTSKTDYDKLNEIISKHSDDVHMFHIWVCSTLITYKL